MKQTLGKLSMLFAFSAALLQLSSCQSEESAPLVHNPSEPVKLTTFYPDSGMYKEQVILEGTKLKFISTTLSLPSSGRQAQCCM